MTVIPPVFLIVVHEIPDAGRGNNGATMTSQARRTNQFHLLLGVNTTDVIQLTCLVAKLPCHLPWRQCRAIHVLALPKTCQFVPPFSGRSGPRNTNHLAKDGPEWNSGIPQVNLKEQEVPFSSSHGCAVLPTTTRKVGTHFKNVRHYIVFVKGLVKFFHSLGLVFL